ncbi:MAG: CBS domain-containing protein [Usitatibacter sp.]
MKTGELCRRPVIAAKSSATLADLARLMRQNHVGSVVIVDGEARSPVGIVTDRDIVVEVIAPGLDARTMTAGEIMTASPVSVSDDDDSLWALKTMRDRGIRRLPLVDKAGALVGILTLDDLMQHLGGALSDVVQLIGSERVEENRRRA